METLWQDIQFALRSLLKTPGFLIVSILSLALGAGANTAIFTAVKSVFLAPLLVYQPGQLVSLGIRDKQVPNLLPLSYPNFEDYRSQQNVFENMTLLMPASFLVTTGGRSPEAWAGEIVSGSFFSVLGIQPALGRVFTQVEASAPGKAPFAVLSNTLWTNRFASDPKVLGRMITLNKHSFQIIGVMPHGFKGINLVSEPDVWTPLSMAQFLMPRPEAMKERKALYFFASARLKPGVTREQAQQALQPITARLAADFPLDNSGRTLELVPITQATINPQYRRVMEQATVILMGIVALILLIACANVAALLLVRARRRSREFAIRIAVGAGVGRIMRQMLTESLLLSLTGGLCGLVVARWARDLLWKFRPTWMSAGALDLSIDLPVLAFTLAVSVLTGILFGLAPAMNAWKRDLASELKERTAQSASERNWFGMRNLLVVGQCALSVIALVGAGLFIESLRRLQQVDPGFDASHLALVRVNPNSAGYTKEQGIEFYQKLAERVSGMPSVRAVSYTSIYPFSSGGFLRGFHLEGQDLSSRGSLVMMSAVWPNYFDTAGIRLLHGREFLPSDREGVPRVIIVNELMARKSWPGANAIGRRIRFAADSDWREVVGVVADTKFFSLTEDKMTCVYIPLLQEYLSQATLVASTTTNPRQLSAMLIQEIRQLEKNMTFSRPATVDEMIGRSLWGQQVAAGLLAVFGLLGLLLASVGIYGLTSYAVAQRTSEIGLRMALGATPTHLLGFIIGQTMLLVMPGLLLGMAASAAASRFAASLLYGMSPLNAPVYFSAALLLALVALLACYFPARRAIKVDPLLALRQE